MVKSQYGRLCLVSKQFYKSINKIYCPCLEEYVIFNSKGLRHLKYDGSNKIRSIKSQVYRMTLLPLVIPVIKQAKEIDRHIPLRKVRFSSKKVEDWSLKSYVGKNKVLIKVVLRRAGNGNIIFLSIMKVK